VRVLVNQTLTSNFLLVFFSEPNNDSPLNAQAAELWTNQEMYKKVLLEKYQQHSTKWLTVAAEQDELSHVNICDSNVVVSVNFR